MKNPSTISSGESDERAAVPTDLHEFKVRLSEYGVAMYHGQGEKACVLSEVLESMFEGAALASQPAESKACASVGGEPVEEGCTPADARMLREANHGLAAENDQLRAALQYYADKRHFLIADEDAWDTVSGEPTNFWCDEAGTATIEDGTVAAMTLRGTPLVDDEEEYASPAPSVGEPKSNNQKEKKCTPTSADGTTQRNACLGIGGGPSSAITSSDTPTERELDLYDEIECDLPYLFGRAAFEGHASAQALADQVREKMKRARFLYATPPAAPAATEAPSDINWKVVGVLIEAHMAASRYHTTGTSNWGAALYKALRREFPAPAPAVGASVQPAAGALPPVRWWSGVVGSPEKLANLLDGYSEKKESPRRDERVMRAAAKWIREVVASVQPVPAILLAKKHEGMRVDYSGLLGQCQRALRNKGESANAEMLRQLQCHLKELGERWYAGDTDVVDEILQLYCIEKDARAALASSTPTKGGEAS